LQHWKKDSLTLFFAEQGVRQINIGNTIYMKNAAEFVSEEDDVFGRIASRYDLLCDLFSFGIHRLWKNRVATSIASEPWNSLLDVASGTGDIVLRILDKKELLPNQKIIVSDISPKMLSIAKTRLEHHKNAVELQQLDAHAIPSIDNASIDVYSMSLGLKIVDREKAISEALRVLKPGGRLITLEASNIPVNWIHKLYLSYMSLCMPLIGWIATKGDPSAYKYLLHGVKGFPKAEELQSELYNSGFENVSFKRLTFGIVAIHVARKPN